MVLARHIEDAIHLGALDHLLGSAELTGL